MAEALTVVGVVASIVQLVDFGSKVLYRLNDFQSSSREIPKAFKHVKDELPVLLGTLKQIRVAVEKEGIEEETKKALLQVVNGCQTEIALLDNLISRLLPQEGDSWARKSGKAILSLGRDAKVAQITTNLRTHIQSLTNYRVAALSILQTSNDPPRPAPSSTVPFRRDRDFVHREILSKMQRKCLQPASRVTLVGLGGVGKSQLAIEYSYQVRESSPDIWVFWVHASSAARFKEGYKVIAKRAKIAGWDNPETDILRLVKNWLSDEVNGRWFMIVDNADDATAFSHTVNDSKVGDNSNTVASAEDLLEFLPQSQNGSILVTSRSRDVAFRITGDTRDIITVDPMDEGLAMDLFHKKLEESFDEEDAKRLLRALDYMPLAITQAASFISQRSPHTTLSKYLQDLQKSDADRIRLLSRHITDTRRDGKASNSIIATWHISFENIRKERPSAAQLLSLMCLFDREGIPKSLLRGRYQESGEAKGDFEDDIYTLSSYSLIGTNVDGMEFEMHRLVQFSTKAWLELRGEVEKWKEKFIAIMDDEFPVGRYENWTICQKLFPHVEKALEYRPANQDYLAEWASIIFNAAWYADDKGDYTVAEKMNGQALDAYEKALGPEHPSTLSSMANLASTYRNQGRWKEAEELQAKELKMCKSVLGEAHPDTLTSMANLASTYRNQGRWKEAEELEVQVMETRKRVLGEAHPSTLTSMANLASTYRSQGRWKEAEELQAKGLKMCKSVLGAEHPDTLISISNLALIFKGQNRYGEAMALMEDCVQMRKRVLGPDHPFTTSSQDTLNEWRMESVDLDSSGANEKQDGGDT